MKIAGKWIYLGISGILAGIPVGNSALAGDPSWVSQLPQECISLLDQSFNGFFFHDPGRTQRKITYSGLEADHLDRSVRSYPVTCAQGQGENALLIPGACYADGHHRREDTPSSFLEDAQFLEVRPDGHQLHYMPGEEAFCKSRRENYLEIAVGYKDAAHRHLVAHAEGCHFKYVAKYSEAHPALKALAQGYAPFQAVVSKPDDLPAVAQAKATEPESNDEMKLLTVMSDIESESSREIELSRDKNPQGGPDRCHLRALRIGLFGRPDGAPAKATFQSMDAGSCISLQDGSHEKDASRKALMTKARVYCDQAKGELFRSLAFDSGLEKSQAQATETDPQAGSAQGAK